MSYQKNREQGDRKRLWEKGAYSSYPHNVEYVIMGAYALARHGAPRRDMHAISIFSYAPTPATGQEYCNPVANSDLDRLN
jgi:hypothetical protein